MTNELIIWIAGTLSAALILNLRLLQMSLNDKLPSPLRTAAIYNFIYLVVIATAAYVLVGVIVSIIAICFSGLLFLILVYVLKSRDQKAIALAEDLLYTLGLLDIQFVYILNELAHEVPSYDLGHSIFHTLINILHDIEGILKLDSHKNANICLLEVKNDGRFEVIAQAGISPQKLVKMEEEFRHGDEIRGLAGFCATTGNTVCLPDLSDNTNPDTKHWIPLKEHDEKIGSIYCYPIKSGIGSTNGNKPIAVLCINSTDKKIHECDQVMELLLYFANKIEMLLYCLEICEEKLTLIELEQKE